MVSLLAVSALAALPALKPLQPPLALFTLEVLQDANTASPQNGDQFIAYGGGACAGRSVSTIRAMGAALTTLERVQTWFKENPGVEAKLFKKDTLAQVMKHASAGAVSRLESCKAWGAAGEWQLPPTDAGKLCEAKAPSTSRLWFAVKGKASSAVQALPAGDACQPRVSIALFDPKGKTRLVLQADFGGVMSATVVGDACKVDFTWDPSIEAFKPEWKSCKG
ncbi:MAG: hypothetical protein ABTQ32_03305 [Myxococcaceae bacterium]